MNTRVLISLPIYKREWIVKHWLKAIEDQTIPLSNIGFQFELGPNDDVTHDLLWEWYEAHSEVFCFDGQIDGGTCHSEHEEGKRSWRKDEYMRMTHFRNSLLERARGRIDEFDFYFSLDSDIILQDPKTLERLITRDKDIVSPLTYMKPVGTDFPNAMDWDKVSLLERSPRGKRVKVKEDFQEINIPMAASLMKPNVIMNNSYSWHPQGEDIGFAVSLFRTGVRSYLDSTLYTPHVMHRSQLKDYLENGDPRSPKSASLSRSNYY